MRILIITHYFPPLNSVASLRPYSWAKHWSTLGHDVTVLTTLKGEQEIKLDLDCSAFKVQTYTSLYSKLLGLRSATKTHGTSKGKGRKGILSGWLRALHKFMGQRGIGSWDARMPNILCMDYSDAFDKVNGNWDLVISTFAPYSAHMIAFEIKKRGQCKKWVVDYRDLWVDSHLYKGLYPFTVFEKMLERRVNTTADLITTVSEPLADKIREKYRLNNIYVVENGFDYSEINNLPLEPFWKDGKIRIVYTGTIHPNAQDPSPLFIAIREICASQEIKLLDQLEIVFLGNSHANLENLIDKYQIGRWVKSGGYVTRIDALRAQRDAHALLFLEYISANLGGILTGKLFEYLASGTQIWGVGVPASSSAGLLISNSGCGICFDTDVQSIKNSLSMLLTSRTKTSVNLPTNLLHRYSRGNLANRILELSEGINK